MVVSPERFDMKKLLLASAAMALLALPALAQAVPEQNLPSAAPMPGPARPPGHTMPRRIGGQQQQGTTQQGGVEVDCRSYAEYWKASSQAREEEAAEGAGIAGKMRAQLNEAIGQIAALQQQVTELTKKASDLQAKIPGSATQAAPAAPAASPAPAATAKPDAAPSSGPAAAAPPPADWVAPGSPAIPPDKQGM